MLFRNELVPDMSRALYASICGLESPRNSVYKQPQVDNERLQRRIKLATPPQSCNSSVNYPHKRCSPLQLALTTLGLDHVYLQGSAKHAPSFLPTRHMLVQPSTKSHCKYEQRCFRAYTDVWNDSKLLHRVQPHICLKRHVHHHLPHCNKAR